MKVWLEYAFNEDALLWPHSLTIVGDEEAEAKYVSSWGWFNWEFRELLGDHMNWRDGQALDSNAGVYGFRTMEFVVQAKMLWLGMDIKYT